MAKKIKISEMINLRKFLEGNLEKLGIYLKEQIMFCYEGELEIDSTVSIHEDGCFWITITTIKKNNSDWAQRILINFPDWADLFEGEKNYIDFDFIKSDDSYLDSIAGVQIKLSSLEDTEIIGQFANFLATEQEIDPNVFRKHLV